MGEVGDPKKKNQAPCVSKINWLAALNPVHIYSKLKPPELRALDFISIVFTSLPKQTEHREHKISHTDFKKSGFFFSTMAQKFL